MWTPLILLTVSLITNANVLPNTDDPATPAMPEKLDEIKIMQYVKHFRQIISDYITSQYRTSVVDLDKVSEVLDQFFKKLAADLNDVMDNNLKDWEVRTVEDGLPNEKFEDMKTHIKLQYPEIKDKSANEIMVRLRQNLFETKQQLDQIMKIEKVEKVEPETEEDYDS